LAVGLELDRDAGGADLAPPAVPPEQSRWELEEGEPIAPGLSALERLGGGLRYEAYLAWDERLHSLVVVKLVRPGLVEDERTLRGLSGEVRMLERLDHPVIVRTFGATLDGPRPHVVLEHLEGPRLSTLLRRYGPLPAEQLIPLALQVCSALHYIAAAGVVHLDVKPTNIIMSAPPRLIDLSVALDLDAAAALRGPVGTDSWMAPEQCDPLARGPVGAAADVWGLGATLYRAATGKRPFPSGDAETDGPARWPQLELPAEPPGKRLPAVVAEPIMACLDPEPARRPSPAQLAEELEPVLGMQPKPRLAPLKPRWK
jgi:serine/threonine-protein kinase